MAPEPKIAIIYPACLRRLVGELEQMGISDSMLRLSVGIEDLEDFFEDLDAGLANVGG